VLGAPGPDFATWEGMNSKYFFILSETWLAKTGLQLPILESLFDSKVGNNEGLS
jgi:hypothetical protein